MAALNNESARPLGDRSLKSIWLGALAVSGGGFSEVVHTIAARTTITVAAPATIQTRAEAGVPAGAPTALPHDEQNLVSPVKVALQEGHVGLARAAPQLLQNLPSDRVPQLEHFVVALVKPYLSVGPILAVHCESLGRDSRLKNGKGTWTKPESSMKRT